MHSRVALSEHLEPRTLFAVPSVIADAVNPANGHQYYLLSPSNRTDAEARANTLGGHLVKVNNNAENQFLLKTFNSVKQIWIGLTDAAKEGTYVWADGGPANFLKWHAGQPDDALNGDTEDFALMVISEGDWRDYFDTNLRNGNGINGVVEVSEPPRQNLTPDGAQMNEFYERTPTDLFLLFDDRVALSSDGRFVAFTAAGSNLLPGDTNDVNDVFVRDRSTGTVERVSVGNGGVQSNDTSGDVSISSNGRFVAFVSYATNLGSPGPGVFVYDRTNKTIERAFALDDDEISSLKQLPTDTSTFVSDDGRFVAYDNKFWDRNNHSVKTIDKIIGMSGDGKVLLGQSQITANGSSTDYRDSGAFFKPAGISRNGRFVAYLDVGSGVLSVLDRNNNSVATKSLDVDADLSISNDGRYVCFSTRSNDIAEDVNNTDDVYVYDRTANTVGLISHGLFGLGGNGPSVTPAISDDGKFVAFTSRASNLVVLDTNARPDVFVSERITAAQSLPTPADDLRIVDDGESPDDGLITFPSTGPHMRRRRISLINGTDDTVILDAGTLSGAGAGNFLLDPKDDGDFQFYHNVSGGDGVSKIDNNNSFSINAHSTGYIDVTFVPKATGHRTATLALDFETVLAGQFFSRNVSLAGDAVAFPLKLRTTDGVGFGTTHQYGNVGIDTDASFDIKVTNVSTSNILLSDIFFTTGQVFGTTAAWTLVPWFINAPADGILVPGATVIKRLQFTTDPFFIGNQGNPTGTSVGNNSAPVNSGNILRDLLDMKIVDSDPEDNNYAVSFPLTTAGKTAAITRTYQLTNTGDYDNNSTLPQSDNMQVTNFKLSDINAGDFTYNVRNDTGMSLGKVSTFTIPKDKTYTVDVKFAPIAGAATAPKAKITFDLPKQDSNTTNNKMTLLLTGTAKTNLSIIRINTGGPDYVDAKGRTWKADNGFTGGSTATFSKTPIGTVDPLLMQKYRKGPNFSYNLPATNGKYLLSLYFAEPMFTAVGDRTFDVTAEDAPPLLAYDVFADAKSTTRKAKRRDFTVNIADGTLNISFAGLNGAEAIVSAIELSPFPA